jgi:hypothetical protein
MSKIFKVQVHFIKNLRGRLLYKINDGIDLVETVLSSYEFHDEVMAAKFTENKGLTNKQIYDMILSGADKFNEETDGDLDLFLTGYYKYFTSVIGYTFGYTAKTWINKKFLRIMRKWSLAGHIVHEYAHNLGFKHKKVKRTSVPYQIGKIVARLAKQHSMGEHLTLIEVKDAD